ncbi:hypothetical protein N7492_005141 [Penicillium capsulatum]|uniref:Ig-like domain-containing protein n=1 Tax=Penicillium capsulatum TaxID=69766 RepID=A0A9W9IBD3_9EURO|nr:hypothetical protein N7492_005141 [Penicillium capsulatum]KAJ6135754.1 hypothetical protein N7512_000914 [Penicillium capsulatum]
MRTPLAYIALWLVTAFALSIPHWPDGAVGGLAAYSRIDAPWDEKPVILKKGSSKLSMLSGMSYQYTPLATVAIFPKPSKNRNKVGCYAAFQVGEPASTVYCRVSKNSGSRRLSDCTQHKPTSGVCEEQEWTSLIPPPPEHADTSGNFNFWTDDECGDAQFNARSVIDAANTPKVLRLTWIRPGFIETPYRKCDDIENPKPIVRKDEPCRVLTYCLRDSTTVTLACRLSKSKRIRISDCGDVGKPGFEEDDDGRTGSYRLCTPAEVREMMV